MTYSIAYYQHKDIDALYRLLDELWPEDEELQRSPTYLFFNDVEMDEEVMRRAEYKVQQYLDQIQLNDHMNFIRVMLTKDQYGLGNIYCDDINFRVYRVPKLIKWRFPHKLVRSECVNWSLLQFFFEDELGFPPKKDPFICKSEQLCPCMMYSDPDLRKDISSDDSQTIPCGPLPRNERYHPPRKIILKKPKKKKKKKSKKGKKDKKGKKGKKGKSKKRSKSKKSRSKSKKKPGKKSTSTTTSTKTSRSRSTKKTRSKAAKKSRSKSKKAKRSKGRKKKGSKGRKK